MKGSSSSATTHFPLSASAEVIRNILEGHFSHVQVMPDYTRESIAVALSRGNGGKTHVFSDFVSRQELTNIGNLAPGIILEKAYVKMGMKPPEPKFDYPQATTSFSLSEIEEAEKLIAELTCPSH